MEPVQESRERQRLFVPTRSSVRPEGPVRRPEGPDGPWASDYPWLPGGQRPDYSADTGRSGLLVLVRIAALAGTVLLLFLLSDELDRPGILFRTVESTLALVGLILLLDLLNDLWRALRQGGARMRWTTFPAFTGGRLEAVFAIRPALEPIGPVLAMLRCVQDERVVRRTESGEEVSFEPVVIYQRTAEIHVVEERQEGCRSPSTSPPISPAPTSATTTPSTGRSRSGFRWSDRTTRPSSSPRCTPAPENYRSRSRADHIMPQPTSPRTASPRTWFRALPSS